MAISAHAARRARHELDLKDDKYGRREAEGVRQVIQGITLATEDDRQRIARGMSLFDDLYRSLQGPKRSQAKRPRPK